MWNSCRSILQPWKTLSGWEFDLLCSLPSDVAKRLYEPALRRATLEMIQTWQWWTQLGLVLVLIALSLAVVWVLAAMLGFGPLGRIALELAFHVTVGLIIFHPLARHQKQYLLPFVHAALADEISQFIRDEKLDGLEFADTQSVLDVIAKQIAQADGCRQRCITGS